MQTAKLFTTGNSQAVRLPKEFRFEGNEVIVKKLGDGVILFPKRYNPEALIGILGGLDPDFRIERPRQGRQRRRAALRAR